MEIPVLIILGAFVVANTVLLSLIYLLLRDVLHTRRARGSVRRLWPKVERET